MARCNDYINHFVAQTTFDTTIGLALVFHQLHVTSFPPISSPHTESAQLAQNARLSPPPPAHLVRARTRLLYALQGLTLTLGFVDIDFTVSYIVPEFQLPKQIWSDWGNGENSVNNEDSARPDSPINERYLGY